MRRNLFLDYDGTLIDSEKRQYGLFIELTGNVALSSEDYWKDKRDGLNQEAMLSKHCKYSPDEKKQFKQQWHAGIEKPERLKQDFLFKGVYEFLDEASKNLNLYLVTARQHGNHLHEQMEQLGIKKFFHIILNTAQRISKAEMVRKYIIPTSNDIFVGDTGEDILAGKELGILSVGVTSGMCSRRMLERYHPNYIIESIPKLSIQDL